MGATRPLPATATESRPARLPTGGAATAAGRVLAVLAAFGPAHPSLTLSEISRRSGLTLTTTHRLVGELRQWGGLERAPDGRYAIGLRLLELGALAPHGLQLRELALPYLDDLHQATRANVHLAVRDGSDGVYVEALRARGAVQVLSRLGGRWPLHATGTGQVLLAFADREVQDELLQAPLKRFTPDTITNVAELRRVLAEVRRTGVAIAENQLTPDALAVAVPVRGERDEVVAALGVTVQRGTVQSHALVPALAATARGISRALGAPSAKPEASNAIRASRTPRSSG
ncbi:IclR family transcriptional regulator [Geodermatophilus sabuli]|uniref:Transcriptional regulator, IclR family n=1 Tax=Geodermatophilus sabuli TaxID=1564158 RepID=A0A285E7W8_9ACTN|nr:IclR family transcriptional regulator [Geodermatophilus sabuli]MBB3082021.1 DNA-binding IclR family transcriptional regulator [Geodermatophilus sabuli]SNX95107.1 transcriptional regulator, IclR family [Geodermatophilus sabuli]